MEHGIVSSSALPLQHPSRLQPRPSNPHERAQPLSSWRFKGEAHIWLGLSRPELRGSTHCIFVPRQPHHPPVTGLSLYREVIQSNFCTYRRQN